MKKSNKEKVSINDLIQDWNENNEYFKSVVPNIDFNEFLMYCIEKYTILPK